MSDAAPAPARTSLRLTAAGRATLPLALVALLVGWGAGGTAGLLAATTYALLLLAPLLAWLCTRAVRAQPPGPAQVFAGETFLTPIAVINRARLFAARDLVLSTGEDRPGAGRPAGHVAELRPGETRRVPLALRLPERGPTETLVLRVSSAWPLGLVRCERRIELPVELLAFPRLGSLGDLGRLDAPREVERYEREHLRRGEEEFHGVREWREGESLRRVHWKLSARRGRTILREHHRRAEPPVELLLATCVDRPTTSTARRRAFEAAVSLAATVAEHHLRRERAVRLVLVGPDALRVVEGAGRNGLWRILCALALVERGEGAPLEALGRALQPGAVGAIAVAAARRQRPGPALAGVRLLDIDDPACELVFQRGRSFGTRPPVGTAHLGGAA